MIVSVEKRRQAGALASITACILSFFTLQDRLVQRAKAQGIPEELAALFTEKFFHGLSAQAATASEEQLHTLATVTTPGGVNYLMKDAIKRTGGFQLWTEPLQEILERLAPEAESEF